MPRAGCVRSLPSGNIAVMRPTAAAALLLAVGLAGCGGGGRSHAQGLPPGAVLLPKLPAQGLIDEERRGIALRDLRGRRLAWLPRFAVYPRWGALTPGATSAFLFARVRPPLLHGPHGWYRLDVGRHVLLPVRGGRLPLAGGATAIASGGQSPRFAVVRGGRTILRGGGDTFRILSRRLVQAGTTLVDVETGRRWTLPPGCLPAGRVRATWILACGVFHAAEAVSRLVLERLEPKGGIRRLAPPLAQLGPEEAWLSPDKRWVAAEGFTGCAASYVYIAPTSGGGARLVYGHSLTNPFRSNYSSLLGWTAQGRLVVLLMPPYCDTPVSGPPPHGVYLIDPRTLTRTFIASSAVAMWNPAPEH
jgi:hypothetical protein